MFDLVHVANRRNKESSPSRNPVPLSISQNAPTIAYQLGATLKLGYHDD